MSCGNVTNVTSDASLPAADEPATAPSAATDRTSASVARVYDCFLGGKDNHDVDREVFEQVNRAAPQMARLARDHREWLVRVTRFRTRSAGIDQFLDFDRPLALIQGSTIHHVSDARRPREIMERYIGRLPAGSYLALTHFYDPQDGGDASELARLRDWWPDGPHLIPPTAVDEVLIGGVAREF
jgi:hypothetical protein